MNSKLGESVSDLHRAKIRLGKFKAVYSSYSANINSVIPLFWKMAHHSLCRMIRNGPLTISKSLKKAENGPLAKISSQSLNKFDKGLVES